MGKYGEVALKAVKIIKENSEYAPLEAWKKAAKEVFGTKRDSINKGCPKSAFLGLCEDGFVNGIPEGNYTRSKLNKSYAIESLKLLRNEPELSEKEIWDMLFEGKSGKTYNQQIDVVKTLFEEGLIK